MNQLQTDKESCKKILISTIELTLVEYKKRRKSRKSKILQQEIGIGYGEYRRMKSPFMLRNRKQYSKF